ncbi:Protein DETOXIFICATION 34, partial [Cucurbita argyrosperma subsp. argyrosperma]
MARFDGIDAMDTVVLHHAPTVLIESSEDYRPVGSYNDARYVCWIESRKLWRIAGPIAFNILCNYGMNSFTSIFVGHIGDLELSAIAISLNVISNFSFGFLLGMGSALETLCGQAYGAGQLNMLGVYMQRSWIILLGTCVVLLPLYIYATPILELLGQEPKIANMAGKFSIQIIPQMFSLAINFPTQKFLQAQSRVGILAWIGFGALLAHVGLLVLFIKVFDWGIAGAAAAYDVSAWGISIAQVVYILGWCSECWKGFSWLAFKDLWDFMKLSLASAIMLCLEIWYFMTIIVLTGHLDDPIIAVGSLSICVRVSNELGLGHPRAAKYSVIVTVVESLCIGLLFAALILATKDYFAIIFTDSKEMQEAVSNLAFLLGITMVLNSVQPVISGVAVGPGGWKQDLNYGGLHINLFCLLFVLCLPLLGTFFC